MGKRRCTATEIDGEEHDTTGKGLEAGSEDDEQPTEVKPLGDVIKRSNKGKSERRHYEAVELDGVRYDLEDAVLVVPEQRGEKPYVAIIKEIKQAKDGAVGITENNNSFHRDEVPAESVMHKCVVHFIPPQKQAPPRTKHPGFIIRHVYDTVEKKLWKLTDKDYEDSKQKEIDLLVQKTREALGELPNVEGEEIAQGTDAADPEKAKRRKTVPPLTVSKEDTSETLAKGDAPFSTRAETPSSCKTPGSGFPSDISEILRDHNALTGQTARDRWLEKIVRTLKFAFDTEGSRNSLKPADVDAKDIISAVSGGDGEQNDKKDTAKWPESAVSAASALEKVAHDFHGADVHKYNLKMRQLDFNLKNSPVLARRFLVKELDAPTVFHMTPVELKDGFTTAEKKASEPRELETLQMTDARCGICGEREVGVKDIINMARGDRYQLECLKCGNSWYGSRDSVSSMTTDNNPTPGPTVGLAPWATSKFETVETDKDLSSPRGDMELFLKDSTVPYHNLKPEEMKETHAPQSHYEAETSAHDQIRDQAQSILDRGKAGIEDDTVMGR